MAIEQDALDLYKPPFRFERGYIFDSSGHMVADQLGIKMTAMQIRGWGRIQYLDNPEALQDEIGRLCALALTEY